MINFSPEQIAKILQNANIPKGNKEQLESAAKSGSLAQFLGKLSPSQGAMLQHFLNDKEAAEKLLSSPQAQALIKKLNGGAK